ncbi:MAG: hypothetical protein AABZ39_01750 [Spirochaetota bacterium]
MQVLLNDTPFDLKVEQEKTVADIIAGMETWCAGERMAITDVVVDGNVLYVVDNAGSDVPISGVKTIHFHAMAYEEYAYTSLTSAYEHIERLVAAKDDASVKLADAVDGIGWLISILPRSAHLLGINLNEENTNEKLKLLEIKKERLARLVNDADASARKFFADDIVPFLADLGHHVLLHIANAEIQLLKLIGGAITAENAHERLASLIGLVTPLSSLLDKVVILLHKGRDKAALTGIDKFCDGVGSIISVLARIQETFSLDYSSITHGNVTLEAQIKSLQDVLVGVLDAFKTDDYVTVSDLLAYELKPRLDTLAHHLTALDTVIKTRTPK